MSLAHETVASLRRRLAKKEIKPRDIITDLLKEIDAREKTIHAYTVVDRESALQAADQADVSLPLGGIPIALKDNLNATGDPCTCSSKILEGYKAPYDATAVARLRKAGAVFLGRTNMDEFAMGSSTENSALGVTRNPWDSSRIPGGSSGGSAAAVAGRIALAALGSDTGGSIRQPAALCGCVGLKPTYGRISRYGLVAFASSLDQIGPLTRTVEDSAILLSSLAGHDPRDNTTDLRPPESFLSKPTNSVKGLKVGLPKEYFIPGMDRATEQAVRAAADWFQKNGAEIKEVSLPLTPSAIAVYYILATAEASANLARFDGVRYGRRAADPRDVLDLYQRTREEGFGPEVKRRIILGTFVLSAGYTDAYYRKAQKVRGLIRQDFEKVFQDCDLLLTPTSPEPAFKLGERTQDPLKMYLADVFTISVNLAGTCGISLPCGFTDSNLPIGLQLIGPRFGEEKMLQAAHAFETAHDFWKRMPAW
ncbi:MAG: Glutamyl-tRNA(Gln) amidotransferase subunit [Verrucomicrobiota bacterium]|jgi:aspartyl-tRNA(Asn)/glutamyl-tRNA(Gln) amidotransferase subunit A